MGNLSDHIGPIKYSKSPLLLSFIASNYDDIVKFEKEERNLRDETAESFDEIVENINNRKKLSVVEREKILTDLKTIFKRSLHGRTTKKRGSIRDSGPMGKSKRKSNGKTGE